MKRQPPLVAPDDLDGAALQAWNELAPGLRPTQAHLLANLCRNRANLLAIRNARAEAVRAGSFQAMTVAKNGATVLNPLVRAETRLLSLENRMLAALGIGEEHFF